MKYPIIKQPEIPVSTWDETDFIEALCSSEDDFKKWWNKSGSPSETFGKIK